jgi:hypothetical protein
MSIREVTMYQVICDGKDCGANAQEDGEFYAWADPSQADDEATGAGWLSTDDRKHYCEDCATWDDDHEERVPKPEKVVTP